MENLYGVLDILKVCLWLGLVIICVALVVSDILRWLASSEKRSKRLDVAGWIAFAVLIVMIFYSRRADVIRLFANSDGSQLMTAIAVNGTKMAVKFLLMGVVSSLVVIIFLVLIVLLSKGVCAALHARKRTVNDWANKFEELGKQFNIIAKTPIFTFIVTCGILSMFIILPLLLGSPEGEAGMAETWVDGVQQFASAVNGSESTVKSADADTDDTTDPEGDEEPSEDTDSDAAVDLTGNSGKTMPIPEAIITYILVYVIVLGVGFSVARILYAIVNDNLKQKQNKTLIDEYSNSIGVLGVGVSILLVLQDNDLDIYQDDLLKILGGFFKYFAVVAIVMALAIVILEVIRLVMDMREALIRKEARYLFVALVGRVSLLILMLLNSIFSALSSAIGQSDEVDISQIQSKLIQRIMEVMDQEVDRRTDDIDQEADRRGEDRDVTFVSFKEEITKK